MIALDFSATPRQRGHCDYYYWRGVNPHFINETGQKIYELTQEQVAEYEAGYKEAEEMGDRKDWE